jgi:hypothetical protein
MIVKLCVTSELLCVMVSACLRVMSACLLHASEELSAENGELISSVLAQLRTLRDDHSDLFLFSWWVVVILVDVSLYNAISPCCSSMVSCRYFGWRSPLYQSSMISCLYFGWYSAITPCCSIKERTSQEDSLRSVCKSSQTWRNAFSLPPCYRPSRIVTSFYRGKEGAS